MGLNPFDVGTKELIWDEPPAWLVRFGIGFSGSVEVVDSDITTLSAAADKVIRVSCLAGSDRPRVITQGSEFASPDRRL